MSPTATADEHHAGTHAVIPNQKNETILIGMRDGVTGQFRVVPREQAVVSVFDSNFLIGDGIWVSGTDNCFPFRPSTLLTQSCRRVFEPSEAKFNLPAHISIACSKLRKPCTWI
jgi:hypothetical protein